MRIIGVDPGLDGAIAVVTAAGAFVSVHDMPTMAASKSSDKRKVNVPELVRIVRAILAEGDVIAITEYVQPMPANREGRPSMPAASAFSFGKSVGHIEACVLTLGISLEWTTPAQWKQAMNLGKDKEHARSLAQSMFPAAELGLKKHHGRAEALLIARWYALKLRRGESTLERTAAAEARGLPF